MLNQLRSGASNIAAKILLACLVLAFALWGVGDIGRHPSQNAAVAKVGSEAIHMPEFRRAYHSELERVRDALGANFSPELVKGLRLESQVLQSMATRLTLEQQSRALGIVPSDLDVVRLIRTNPIFKNSAGEFDKDRFYASLRNAGLSEQTYVEQMRNRLATSIIMETLASQAPVSDAAVKALYAAAHERRTALLYKLNESMLPPSATPTDEQLDTFYKTNPELFTEPEFRSLSYVTIRPEDAHANASVTEDELKAAYKERLSEFARPEQRQVEQLLYSSEESAKQAYEQLKAGEKFAAVGAKTPISNKGATSLGAITRDHILDAAAGPVFSLKEGEFTQPIQSPFGWHVFYVSKILPASTASFEEVRADLEKDLTQQSRDDAFGKLANAVEDALAAGSSLEEAASQQGLKLQRVSEVNASGKTRSGADAKNLPSLDKFLETAFKTDEKTESGLMTSKGGVYYIVRVESVSPQHVKPLETVKAQAIAKWQESDRQTRLRQLANTLAKQMADPKTRDKALSERRLSPVTTEPLQRTSQKAAGLELPPTLVADIFAQKPGDSTAAYGLKDGQFVIAVAKDVLPAPAPEGKAALDEMRKTLETDMQNEIVEQYMAYLGTKYPLSINQNVLNAAIEQ